MPAPSNISRTSHSDAPESPRRRRTRPASSSSSTTADNTNNNSMLTTTATAATNSDSATMTATTSWSAVKQDFMKTVSKAVAELMQEHGYSRERATSAVLREISVSAGGGESKTPQDIEIFQTMRRYNLGSEQSVKAMTVSDALERTVAENGVSVMQAVTDLTVRLANHKFGQEHEDVDGSSSTRAASSDLDLDSVVPVPATPLTITTTTSSIAASTKQAPDLNSVRIKPVSSTSIERLTHDAHTRSSSFSSTNAVMGGIVATNSTSNSKKAKSSANKNSGKVKSSSKGDSHVSSKDNSSQETSRPRSDSVSDIVTAKLGEKTAKTDADKTGVKNAPTATPQSVRGKRGRSGEETEVTASTHKRSRQSSA